MGITLIHPSRGRPQKARETYEYWIANASNPENIEHILSLDFSDPLNEEYDRFDKLTIDHNTCVVEATNQAAKIATGDILIYLSDDFKCPAGWDVEIINAAATMIHVEPNSIGSVKWLLKVHDCLQPFDKDILTIPIMSRALYNHLKYFWNPLYKSMFVDQDLFWVCKNNDWIGFAPHLQFPHEHYSIGKSPKDETYTRSDANWNQGKETYAKRKMEGFPI